MSDRHCKFCNANHPLTPEFWSNLSGRRSPRCKARQKELRARPGEREKANARRLDWESRNPEVRKDIGRRWRLDNAEHNLKLHRAWHAAHPGKNAEYIREFRLRHPGYNSKYRRRLQRATPLWADLIAITAFYAACPPGYHVDHIVPLKGKLVSGLHVLENLQYLPAAENLRKNNRFEV